ncbi:MAG TPA: nuclear transport factor 2 family protein [Ktedonobacteraceae bacterium]|nr:nuclear transport factor 2 family protein [Ktedonobacteraceae bacterium]
MMTEHASTSVHDLVVRTFAALSARDLEAMMCIFADDAVVIDPHFPTPRMQGKAAIRKGFQGAISGMRSFGYTIVNYCESENGQCAAVETATHHVLKSGMRRNFPQVFIFEMADGHIKRLQAYEPYGPHGIMGVFLSLARLTNRFLKI